MAQLTPEALLQQLKNAGFRGNGLRTAWAIATRESSGNPQAFNGNAGTGDKSYGLFQINMLGGLGPARLKQYGLSSNDQLFDPSTNAKVAFRMSHGGTDFGAWGLGPNAYKGAPAAAKTRFDQIYQRYPGDTGTTGVAPRVAPLASATSAGGSAIAVPQPRSSPFVQALLNQTSKILGTPAPQLPAFSAPRPLPMAPQPHPAAGGPTATPAVPGSTVGAKIAKTALTQLGTPYQWGGPAKLGSRTDCSGLLQASAAANGIRIGRTTYEQWKQGTPVPLNQLQPGDAVFSHADSRGPGHVSIYIGNGQIVEDPHTGEVVSISDLAGRAGVIGARRYG